MRGENPAARLTDGLDACPQVPQEDRLGDDGPEASSLGFEHAEDRAIDRLGLPARLRNVSGRLAVKEEFPGLGTFDPTENDRAAMRLDRLGNGMGRHFDPLAGDGLAIPLRGIVRSVTWPRDYVSSGHGFLHPSVGSCPSGSEE